MKKILFTLTCFICGLLFCNNIAFAQPTRVACVGNSITYGAGIVDRDKNSYPVQLGCMLGNGFEVKNFGISGTTLMNCGDSPYIKVTAYKASLDYKPNIVLIKLGTNDSKDFNRDFIKENFKKDYQTLIDSYKSLPNNPRIILLKPVRCYLLNGSFKGANDVYEKEIIPAIEALAYENSLEIIDLYHLFSDKWDKELLPDRLHPSAKGATIIAKRLSQQILNVTTDFKISLKSSNQFNFHGYKGHKIGQDMVVEPKQAAKGNPWIIRARFWNHEPQTDIALLEKGFHLAYCDVADLYGAPVACKRWDDFYKRMTKAGLSKKVVLEGMSRGGLIVFNWAAKNAGKVAAIYADAPVLDFKSWPMGLGSGEGSTSDTKQLLKVYGYKDVEAATKWKGNPIDNIKKLSHIPIILVIGDADKVVPPSENSSIFEL
ncbi:MAG: GDSL-type esterase/lipase family protein, partial [Rikenellaceae bacterium]